MSCELTEAALLGNLGPSCVFFLTITVLDRHGTKGAWGFHLIDPTKRMLFVHRVSDVLPEDTASLDSDILDSSSSRNDTSHAGEAPF